MVGPRKLPNANTEVHRPETTALVVAVLEYPGMLRVARRQELYVETMQAAEPAPWVTRLGRIRSREGERGR